MKIQLEQQDIVAACKRGVQMLDSDSLQTPNAWNDDLVALRIMLASILQGSYSLVPNVPQEVPTGVKLKAHENHDGDGPKLAGVNGEQPKAN